MWWVEKHAPEQSRWLAAEIVSVKLPQRSRSAMQKVSEVELYPAL